MADKSGSAGKEDTVAVLIRIPKSLNQWYLNRAASEMEGRGRAVSKNSVIVRDLVHLQKAMGGK